MTATPPVISPHSIGEDKRPGVFGGEETAAFLIQRARIDSPSLAVPGGVTFTWDAGLEGFVVSGQATVAEHKYIGDNAVVGFVTHRDSRRIEMNGVFLGKTAIDHMQDLIEVIMAETPPNGKLLTLPWQVYIKQHYVIVNDYSFSHPADTRTMDIEYTINFLDLGPGKKKTKVKVKAGSPVNPRSKKGKEKGKSSRVFITKDGGRTLGAVAKLVYGNSDRWNEIYTKNKKLISSLKIPTHMLRTKVLPVGLHLTY